MKNRSTFICQQCGYQSPTLLGKCPECGSWGSLVEQLINKFGPGGLGNTINNSHKHSRSIPKIIRIADIEKKSYQRISTKIDEFDRVLGGVYTTS